jgi:hypothetical protein
MRPAVTKAESVNIMACLWREIHLSEGKFLNGEFIRDLSVYNEFL